MIVGSGLLARAFGPAYSGRPDICVYAAGVSNSNCEDTQEFLREQRRVDDALNQCRHADAFVYFGTCSSYDPEISNRPYVQHKLAMERMVRAHPRHVVLRLPQIAGKTPNPHTLLNYLYARISRSEAFKIWGGAKRNIMDVDDVVAIGRQLIENGAVRNVTINIANPVNYPIADIVEAMVGVVGKRAIFEVVNRVSDYFIETGAMQPALAESGVEFGRDYLRKVIAKYYG
jgi:nucleoside-diphosphate-sugar epimerase